MHFASAARLCVRNSAFRERVAKKQALCLAVGGCIFVARICIHLHIYIAMQSPP